MSDAFLDAGGGTKLDGKPLKRVFIIGFPRSGTTWVMWLLAQHPEIEVLQQSGMFHALDPLVRWWNYGHSFSCRDAEQVGGSYAMKTTKEILDAELLSKHCRSLCGEVLERIAAESPGTRAVVEQTPENVRFADFIESVFPDAYFLHVLRDPRAAYSSMRSAANSWGTPGGFPTHPVQVADAWRRYVQLADKKEAAGGRVYQVRYEDLKADAPAELAGILAWLGFEVGKDFCAEAAKACEIDKLRAKTEAPEGFFRRGTTGGWREEISSSTHQTIEYVAGEVMAQKGYACEHPRAGQKPWRMKMYEANQKVVAWAKRKGALQRPLRLLKKAGRTVDLMGGKLP